MAPADAGVFTKVAAGTKADLPVEGALPGFSGAVEWLNSAPLTPHALRGKVLLLDFWTFNCVNCLHALPYVRAWAEKYRDYGLVVVGVHTPELAFERDIGNVRKAVARLKIDYPVAIDNGYAIWKMLQTPRPEPDPWRGRPLVGSRRALESRDARAFGKDLTANGGAIGA